MRMPSAGVTTLPPASTNTLELMPSSTPSCSSSSKISLTSGGFASCDVADQLLFLLAAADIVLDA